MGISDLVGATSACMAERLKDALWDNGGIDPLPATVTLEADGKARASMDPTPRASTEPPWVKNACVPVLVSISAGACCCIDRLCMDAVVLLDADVFVDKEVEADELEVVDTLVIVPNPSSSSSPSTAMARESRETRKGTPGNH